mmetsp:Transcript_70279/g.186913  ORF Transcript_70279/g.186913 Transcript_70279/m.186913 type:complete len:223 (-) Transcript_70279:386-1054(-)
MPRVVRKTAQVPYAVGALGLHVVGRVRGLAHQLLDGLPWAHRHLRLPEGPCPRAMRWLSGAVSQRRGVPSVTSICRHVDANDRPAASRPREATHRQLLLWLGDRTGRRREDNRLHRHLLHRRVGFDVDAIEGADRRVEDLVGHPALPHALRLLRRGRHLAKPLDVAYAHVTRHDGAQREAVVGGQRLAVHLVSEQHVAVLREGLGGGNGGLGPVDALKLHMP